MYRSDREVWVLAGIPTDGVMMTEPRLFLVPDVPVPDEALDVFEHWVAVLREGRPGPRPVLTAKRRALLERWLPVYGFATLLAAIDGCARSDWHQGQNPRGRRYDSLELIFRDAEHIERFATLAAEHAGDGPGFTETPEVRW